MQELLEEYHRVRTHSENICKPLNAGDYAAQPIVDVSPPKWHLAHSTWFFETFLLKERKKDYHPYHERYGYLFNSYYEHEGERVKRDLRGNLIRPYTEDIYAYRKYVDQQMEHFLNHGGATEEVAELLVLGLNHEQQHQELLITDIKYIFAQNPLFPIYNEQWTEPVPESQEASYISIPGGIYDIGYEGDGFCFDNELARHQVLLEDFQIRNKLVTVGEYLAFMKDGGYHDFRYWLMEGWEWVKKHGIEAPEYWHKVDGQWHVFTMNGLQPVNPDAPLTHVSYYEADAFASWAGRRLPTEFEWEAAHQHFSHGKTWEWTGSAYLPYPRFQKAPGAIGEYNGKFMVNQMVLRGGSIATPEGHARPTYRNFFHPDKRWQYAGIRLAQ